jgi:hypothetical protein
VFFGGDAPNIAPATNLFQNANNATVYYLPEATGWNSTFGGAPTVLWNPHVANDPDLGVKTNGFGFNIIGTAGIPLVVEASANLDGGGWTVLGTTL